MAVKTVLFLAKTGDEHAQRALKILEDRGLSVTACVATRGEAMPEAGKNWQGDLIVSYLSPWIVPQVLLDRAQFASINFHPGPPEYPGIGCTNFAIYDEAPQFGVVCHHMKAKVDTGAMIQVARFPLLDSDSVYSLTQKCYEHIAQLFDQVMTVLFEKGELPSSDENWTRIPYTRKELNALCKLTDDMSDDEVRRRVRAVTFPGYPGAYFERAGFRFDCSGAID